MAEFRYRANQLVTRFRREIGGLDTFLEAFELGRPRPRIALLGLSNFRHDEDYAMGIGAE
jgi:hypothetical protein